MKKNLLLSAIIFISVGLKISAQQRTCASYEVVKQQMTADPAYARTINENEKKFQKYIRQFDNTTARQMKINIPVVVHVVYNTAAQNISDAQVQSQIDVLNEDYTATNKDYNKYDAGYTAVKGDVDIKFCLAQVIHKATDKKSFGANDQIKRDASGGSDPVDPMHFLNIWVCNLGQNLLGYAYYPGIKADKYGAVIHYLSFGRGAAYSFYTGYDLGRTATHEIGHCLGLVHIWGDRNCGDDLIDDTPLQDSPNFGCPPQGLQSTCVGTPVEMWMNYMDYTDDRCMYFFTDGQATRADFFMNIDPQLNSIISSNCSHPPGNNNNDITNSTFTNSGVSRMNNPAFSLYPTITSGNLVLSVNNSRSGNAQILIYSETGALVMKQTVFITKGSTENGINAGKLANGAYILQLNQGTEKQTRKFIVQH